MKAFVLLAGLLLTAAPNALAQKPGADPISPGNSSLLIVDSTDPVIHDCNDGWSTSCFRIVLQIRARAGTVNIGHIPTHRNRHASAFTGAGASCAENGARGLPDVVVWSSGTLRWREPPTAVTADRPATLLLSFGCDSPIGPGDQVNIELALAVDPDGRQVETARFTLTSLQLVSSPHSRNRR
ncbi:MAG TPA: hypothetical protein VF695_00650, partial [Sphingomonas sp.]|jgi:hypothetical protein